MKGSLVRKVLISGAWAFALPALLFGEPTIRVGEPTTAEPLEWISTVETRNTMDRIADHAAQVAAHAGTLRALVQNIAGGDSSRQQTVLSNIQRLADAMGEDLCSLHAVSGDIGPTQQIQVDHITPDIVELADKTDAALEFLGGNPTAITKADYRGFVTEIQEDALRIHQVAARRTELVQISATESEDNFHIAVDYCGF